MKTKKELALELRKKNLNVREISKVVGVHFTTVAKWLRNAKQEELIKKLPKCPNCGKVIRVSKGHNPRKFCSDKCRTAWWRKSNVNFGTTKIPLKECDHCKKLFKPKRKNQKYCCRFCYLCEVTNHE